MAVVYASNISVSKQKDNILLTVKLSSRFSFFFLHFEHYANKLNASLI